MSSSQVLLLIDVTLQHASLVASQYNMVFGVLIDSILAQNVRVAFFPLVTPSRAARLGCHPPHLTALLPHSISAGPEGSWEEERGEGKVGVLLLVQEDVISFTLHHCLYRPAYVFMQGETKLTDQL